ncbi:uncharacterized protein KY384_005764 [Bacidia gigantensis]|uniref:uncharacterized protein n=1 Tax=Bacidia gigantensis TaxID=2732470 RepID=UPI001D0398B8|nr:uncharacterized protein KY384_005764 [Bacidia gigantensis]KAG8529129.1 hypothetical protein KY384_005764 [Bacidia gigantensis]
MSGLEVAGLVAGVLPIVQLGIDRYKRGLAGKEMRQLARSFATQQNIYMNTIEEIISPVLPDSQFIELLQDPGGKSWQDPILSEKLENHLGTVYPAFKDTMIDIKEIMDEMQKIFNPPPDSVGALKPIKEFLHRSKGEIGVERLNRRLSELETLKNQSQNLAVIRQEKEAKLEVVKHHTSMLKGNIPHKGQTDDALKTYRKVRNCARSLYSALSRGWHCECGTPHHANLRLEARRPSQSIASGNVDGNGSKEDKGRSQDIRFKFMFSYATEGKAEAERNVHQHPPLDWREAEIAPLIYDPDSITNSPAVGQRSTSDGECSHQERGSLPQHKHDHEPPKSPERPRVRATRFVFPEPKKAPLPQRQAKKQDINKAEEVEIKDLCKLIKNIQESHHDDDDDKCLYSMNARKDVKAPVASIHIGEPLQPAPNVASKGGRIKRQKLFQGIRYDAAFALASTVLQLHSTEWLDNWAKEDILYLPTGQIHAGSALPQPYISKRFLSSRVLDATSPASGLKSNPHIWVANETLLTLSIVLIELAYNKPIEALAEESEETAYPIVTAQLVAKRLSKEIFMEMGQLYQLAVAWCLSCDLGFTLACPSLHSTEFEQSFLENVIIPLQRSTDFFFSPAYQPRSRAEHVI